ncbi:MAG: hypothetical protein A2665_00565 [Candidatus Zambryskibacteria bacterium RIFCSPHIGHO2_01_FULL_46_30]|uniref:Uncharacterized protein n=1 Tax=Candidatus Zambryskibacteria bacterium RIFCSPHIGHO2_01_FULL_46_30 TaxID=1802739 RepID=A0A1G2T5G0_9BACT|nr:MAG: hypothetical protein A2665_00565 [Candidatus Zambryskibacteria bacterium RIFCSPHIGHO2_01_FULL_46_30]OHB06455.1 MAG: hypothetical protein A3B22_01835 [Candidatus Zambryskibacteria bacterium RIFCSPLOWO2_01_FULL_47_33]
MEEEQNNVNAGIEEGGGLSGPLIGVIVILAVIILGGLYFWGQRASDDAMIDETSTEGGSDETAAIEADLDTFDIESLDSELN